MTDLFEHKEKTPYEKTLEENIIMAVTLLSNNRFDKGFLCDNTDEDFNTLSNVRAIIHSLVLILFYSSWGNENTDIKIQNKITHSRSHMGEKCRHEYGRCHFCIGTAIFIKCHRIYGRELDEKFEKSSGCGFVHDKNEVKFIREKVDGVLDRIVNDDMMNKKQIYENILFKCMMNIENFYYNTKKSGKTFKLQVANLYNFAPGIKHVDRPVIMIEIPKFSDHDLFYRVPNKALISVNEAIQPKIDIPDKAIISAKKAVVQNDFMSLEELTKTSKEYQHLAETVVKNKGLSSKPNIYGSGK